MKRFFCQSLLFIFISIIIACGNDSNGVDSPTIRTADDVRNDFQNLNIQPGINDLTLESTVSGLFWNFRLIVPEDASESNKRPLVLRLHGGASNDSPEAHKSTSCLVEPGLEILNAYIVSPNSNSYLWFEQENQLQVLALVDLVSTYLHIDTSKTAVMGYSDGGNGSWFYANYYSNLFSAAIPMASSYNPVNSAGVVEKIEIPLYVIHGENDELFPVEVTEGYVNDSKAAGSTIEFVIASGLDHYAFCDYLTYLQDAANWLKTDVWTN